MAKEMIGKLAIYTFIGGIALAAIFGLYQAYTIEKPIDMTKTFFQTDLGGIVAWILVIIGALVGLLAMLGKGTITKTEVPGFLTAGIALLVMYAVFSGFGFNIPYYIGSLLIGVSLSLALFIAPAVAILAIKAIWDLGKDV
jgi:glucan phosphoethanolaminetransferase (alkaline phosphatase superfamily)